MDLEFTTVHDDKHLSAILALQQNNLPQRIEAEEMQKEGFVTVQHDFALLKEMNSPYPHVIAINDSSVVAYALVMLRKMESKIPILVPMFAKINALIYQGIALEKSTYFIMGQICIDKAWRGQGVFKKLYETLKTHMKAYFQYCITEVSLRNPRSMRAHLKVGFVEICQYKADDGEEWSILLWDLRQ